MRRLAVIICSLLLTLAAHAQDAAPLLAWVTARGSTDAFSPLSLSGCVLWLDSADMSTITTGADARVTAWRDKSGEGNDATPMVFPVYDGPQLTNNLLYFGALNNLTMHNLVILRPFTICIFAKQIQAFNGRIIQSVGYNALITYRRSANVVYMQGDIVKSSLTSDANFHGGILRANATNTDFYFDGVAKATGVANTTDWGVMAIGCGGFSKEPSYSYIRTIVAYDRAITDGEIAQIKNWMESLQ